MSELLDFVIVNQGWIAWIALSVAFLAALQFTLAMFSSLGELHAFRGSARHQSSHEDEDEDDGRAAIQFETHSHLGYPRRGISRTTETWILLGAGASLAAAGLLEWSKGFGRELISPTVALDPPALVRHQASNKRLLILIHGWNGDPMETWKAFPSLLTADPALAGFDVWPIAYPTFQVRRNLSIRQMSRWLNVQMDRDGYYDKYESIYIIAHSMGGLIARGILLENRLSRDNKQYKTLIEIATPHQGADIGGLLATIGVSKGFSDDLKPGSPMLNALQDDWNALKDRPKTYCLTSPQDSVVTQDSAIFQCDEYLRYPQWGHTDMVKPTNLADERYRVPTARVEAISTLRDHPEPTSAK